MTYRKHGDGSPFTFTAYSRTTGAKVLVDDQTFDLAHHCLTWPIAPTKEARAEELTGMSAADVLAIAEVFRIERSHKEEAIVAILAREFPA